MHTRMGLGLGILLLFLLLGLVSGAAMEKACSPVTRLLEQASRQDDPQVAIRLAKEAKRQWERHNGLISALADHTPMEEIDSLFAQALSCARSGQNGDFSALCRRLACLVTAVSEAHSLKWQNII